jgi:hypothetical protein
METFVEFFPQTLAEPQVKFPSRSSTTEGVISHLALHTPCVNQEALTILVLAAFTNEASSYLHEFAVHLPFQEVAVPWSRQVYDCAKTLFRHVMNLSFFLMQTDHERLPEICTPTVGATVTYNGAHPVRLSPYSPRAQGSLISLSALCSHPTEMFLATLLASAPGTIDQPQRNYCVLLSSNDPKALSSAMFPLTSIIPLVPNPFLAMPLLTPPTPLPRGHYARMLALSRAPDDQIESPDIRAGATVEHDYTCGQTRWGNVRDETVLGAFLYQPASLQDLVVGVALFEMTMDDE